MKEKRLEIFSMVFVLLLAGFLYFYKLKTIPSGFYVDEASVAYNAVSIAETGRDEYGFFLPVYFRLMGSYTPPLFIYLSALLVRFLGDDILVYRLISVVSSVFGIFFFHLLIKELNLFKNKFSNFATTLFYAISPWVIFNARLGYETTLGFVVFNIGIYFLLKSLKNPKNLYWAFSLFSVSTYISHNQRFLAPLLLFLFFAVFRKKFFKKGNLKHLGKAVFLAFLINIPNILMLGTNAFWIKSSQFNLRYFWNILTYLSPKTLFYENPDIDMQHTIPKMSMLFNWMVFPYLIGFYLAVKKLKDERVKFIFIYILSVLIPAIFSSNFISSQKSFSLIIPLLVIIGLGMDRILKSTKKVLGMAVFGFLFVYSFVSIYTAYFFLFPKERANGWNYGYDKIAEFVKDNPDEQFLFDDTRNPRLYILLLYFLKIPPDEYHREVDSYYRENYYDAPPPATYYHFADVDVRRIDWEKDPLENKIIVGDPLSISEKQMLEHKLSKLTEINDPLGNVIFEIYRTASKEVSPK